MDHQLQLFLTMILIMYPVKAFSDFSFLPTPVTITPEDARMLIGESLIMTCTIDSSATAEIEPEELFFRVRYNQDYHQDYQAINRTNNSASTIIPITQDLANSSHITVMCGKDGSIHSTFIFIDYAPQEVIFESTVHTWMESLNVSWNIGYYLNNLSVSVIAVWEPDMPPPEASGNVCTGKHHPQNDAILTSCDIQTNAQTAIFVQVTVQVAKLNKRYKSLILNEQPDKVTALMNVTLRQHVKPKVPSQLVVGTVNGTCLEVTWSAPPFFQDVDRSTCVYFIHAQWLALNSKPLAPTDLSIPSDRNVSGVLDNRDLQHVTVCGLQPYSQYRLSLIVKPLDSGYFSDPAVTTCTTPATLPAVGPDLVTFWSQACDSDRNTRQVRVLWNPLPLPQWHGDPVRYSVQSSPTAPPVPILSQGNFFEMSLGCETSTNVTVRAENNKGVSILPSEMVIPQYSDMYHLDERLDIRLEETIGQDNLRNLTLLWYPDFLPQDSALTLNFFYCVGSNPNTCFDRVEKKHAVSATQGLWVVQVPLDQTVYAFSLTGESGRASGLVWITCVYQAHNGPADQISSVVAEAGKARNTIEVKWLLNRCDSSRRLFIAKVHILLCYHSHYSQDCQVVERDSISRSFVFTGLEKGHEYTVFVQPESISGALGPLSDPATATPTNSDLETEDIVGIVMGSLVGLLIMAIFIVLCLRWRKKRKEHWNMISDEISEFWQSDGEPNPKVKQAEKETDSGHCTDSSNSRQYIDVRFAPTHLATRPEEERPPRVPSAPPCHPAQREASSAGRGGPSEPGPRLPAPRTQQAQPVLPARLGQVSQSADPSTGRDVSGDMAHKPSPSIDQSPGINSYVKITDSSQTSGGVVEPDEGFSSPTSNQAIILAPLPSRAQIAQVFHVQASGGQPSTGLATTSTLSSSDPARPEDKEPFTSDYCTVDNVNGGGMSLMERAHQASGPAEPVEGRHNLPTPSALTHVGTEASPGAICEDTINGSVHNPAKVNCGEEQNPGYQPVGVLTGEEEFLSNQPVCILTSGVESVDSSSKDCQAMEFPSDFVSEPPCPTLKDLLPQGVPSLEPSSDAQIKQKERSDGTMSGPEALREGQTLEDLLPCGVPGFAGSQKDKVLASKLCSEALPVSTPSRKASEDGVSVIPSVQIDIENGDSKQMKVSTMSTDPAVCSLTSPESEVFPGLGHPTLPLSASGHRVQQSVNCTNCIPSGLGEEHLNEQSVADSEQSPTFFSASLETTGTEDVSDETARADSGYVSVETAGQQASSMGSGILDVGAIRSEIWETSQDATGTEDVSDETARADSGYVSVETAGQQASSMGSGILDVGAIRSDIQEATCNENDSKEETRNEDTGYVSLQTAILQTSGNK